MSNATKWPGVMDDGSQAPFNNDRVRMDWLERNPGKVKNMKRGVIATSVKTQWQPSVRAAVDAEMEFLRRELRAKGLDPKW